MKALVLASCLFALGFAVLNGDLQATEHLPSCPGCDDITARLANLEETIQAQQAEIDSCQSQVVSLTNTVTSLDSRLSQTELTSAIDHSLGSDLNPANSCLQIKQTNPSAQDGAFYLVGDDGTVYQTYCDMTTAGGGWTLVSSVHEDDMYGKCTAGDRWSSTRGNNVNYPEGDGNWANVHTFGSMGSATTDDYKNPGYYSIDASDVMLWHVPNNVPAKDYKSAAYLRYRTANGFLTDLGGNLYSLFKDHYPIAYGLGTYTHDNGPAIPIVYERGHDDVVMSLLSPNEVSHAIPGFVQFRAFDGHGACSAVCPGVNYVGANAENVCIGGGGYWPQSAPRQCGDFGSKDWNGYGTYIDWSTNVLATESVIMFFYR